MSTDDKSTAAAAGPVLSEGLGPLPRTGPICYAMLADVQEYRVPRVGRRLPGVYDVALWSTDQMRAYATQEVAAAMSRKAAARPLPRVTTAAELRQQAKSDTSCVGAFARARPGA